MLIRSISNSTLPQSVFIFGDGATGKSTAAINTALTFDKPALVISTSNLRAVYENRDGLQDWGLVTVTDWTTFADTLKTANKDKKYGTVILDTISGLLTVALQGLVTGQDIQQRDWNRVSREMVNGMQTLQRDYENLIVTSSTQLEDDGKRRHSLNPFLLNMLIGMFSEKWYTDVRRKTTTDGQPVADYVVQRNPYKAMRFVQGEE